MIYYIHNFKIFTDCLTTSEFNEESQTGEAIRNLIADQLLSCGIQQKSFNNLPFTTDCGSNIKCALKEFN
jgi:hypothetical protein